MLRVLGLRRLLLRRLLRRAILTVLPPDVTHLLMVQLLTLSLLS